MVKKPGACWWDSVPLTWSCIFTQVLKRRLWTSLAAVLIMKRLPGGEAWWESSHVPQSLCLIPTPCVSVFSEVAFELPSVCSLTSKLWQKLPISSSQGEKLWGCVCGRRGTGGGGCMFAWLTSSKHDLNRDQFTTRTHLLFTPINYWNCESVFFGLELPRVNTDYGLVVLLSNTCMENESNTGFSDSTSLYVSLQFQWIHSISSIWVLDSGRQLVNWRCGYICI